MISKECMCRNRQLRRVEGNFFWVLFKLGCLNINTQRSHTSSPRHSSEILGHILQFNFNVMQFNGLRNGVSYAMPVFFNL